MLNGNGTAPKVVVGGSLGGLFNAIALALADYITATGGDVVETLRRWDPDQMELGERLRDYGHRLDNRSQFDR